MLLPEGELLMNFLCDFSFSRPFVWRLNRFLCCELDFVVTNIHTLRMSPTYFFELEQKLKSGSDASDELYGADRHRVVKAVLNNSLQKGHLQAKNSFLANYCTPNCSKIGPRPYFGMISIPFRHNIAQAARIIQNSPNTSKNILNRPKYLPNNLKIESCIKNTPSVFLLFY